MLRSSIPKGGHDLSSDHRIELRIGIHVGDVVHREGDVYGDGVNILRASNRWPGLVEFAFPWMWNGRSIMHLRPDLKSSLPLS